MVKGKRHPWRLCGIGSHYVSAHYKILASGKNRLWSAHCRKSKGRKNILTADEIRDIYKIHSHHSVKMPSPYKFKSHHGLKYDKEIGFWTQFWKEVFDQKTKITPDFVKTLMMSESSFDPRARAKTHNGSGNALGLMQITEYTFKLLAEDKKELRDFYFKVSKKRFR
jgi:soluble lytic murein transglycosylase-like protein